MPFGLSAVEVRTEQRLEVGIWRAFGVDGVPRAPFDKLRVNGMGGAYLYPLGLSLSMSELNEARCL